MVHTHATKGFGVGAPAPEYRTIPASFPSAAADKAPVLAAPAPPLLPPLLSSCLASNMSCVRICKCDVSMCVCVCVCVCSVCVCVCDMGCMEVDVSSPDARAQACVDFQSGASSDQANEGEREEDYPLHAVHRHERF